MSKFENSILEKLRNLVTKKFTIKTRVRPVKRKEFDYLVLLIVFKFEDFNKFTLLYFFYIQYNEGEREIARLAKTASLDETARLAKTSSFAVLVKTF